MMECADQHLMSNFSGCISDSSPSVLLNLSINSFNIARRSWSGQTARAVFFNGASSATLAPFQPFVHCVIQFSPHCANILL